MLCFIDLEDDPSSGFGKEDKHQLTLLISCRCVGSAWHVIEDKAQEAKAEDSYQSARVPSN